MSCPFIFPNLPPKAESKKVLDTEKENSNVTFFGGSEIIHVHIERTETGLLCGEKSGQKAQCRHSFLFPGSREEKLGFTSSMEEQMRYWLIWDERNCRILMKRVVLDFNEKNCIGF